MVFVLSICRVALAQEHVHEAEAPHASGPFGELPGFAMRMGSGTGWAPEAMPMFGFMGVHDRWAWMAHAIATVGWDWQGTERGASEPTSINWAMAQVWQDAGRGYVSARAMVSAEPWTVRRGGYPLLGQTGETYLGRPLIDRQHPHELFMELSVQARQAITDELGVLLYVAPMGEPALGPVAFPHRTYGYFDPLAPIGHHWQDATHIASTVATVGLFTDRVQVDASVFHGREPDERRWDLELGVPDSFSTRLTVAPGDRLVLQGSYGFLREPEILHPGEDVHRITASLLYDQPMHDDGLRWSGGLVWGRNIAHDEATDAVLAEGVVSIGAHANPYARVELATKPGEDLGVGDDVVFLSSMALGHLLTLEPVDRLTVGLGTRFNVLWFGEALASSYGQPVGAGAFVYLTVRPSPVPMLH